MGETGFGKVTVKIFGQEYTFASAKPKDRIVQVANHVDEVLRSLEAQGAGGPPARLSMLAAINVAEELFEERGAQAESEREQERLRKDIAHFQQLWEEAKRTHLQYKDDAKAVQGQKDALAEKISAMTIERDSLSRQLGEQEKLVRRLEGELASANEKLASIEGQSVEGSELIREMKDKIKEIEGNYFELQMENIQMKGDLERYKNNS